MVDSRRKGKGQKLRDVVVILMRCAWLCALFGDGKLSRLRARINISHEGGEGVNLNQQEKRPENPRVALRN